MKIQLSPTRVMEGYTTVWYEHGPEVDIVMDLKNLTFAEGSLESLVAFHVLDHFFENEVQQAITNWRTCLKNGASAFVVVDDFEYLCRMHVGGDIDVDTFNKRHAHPIYFTRDNLVKYLMDNGFKGETLKLWYANVPNMFEKKDYEAIVEAQKL